MKTVLISFLSLSLSVSAFTPANRRIAKQRPSMLHANSNNYKMPDFDTGNLKMPEVIVTPDTPDLSNFDLMKAIGLPAETVPFVFSGLALLLAIALRQAGIEEGKKVVIEDIIKGDMDPNEVRNCLFFFSVEYWPWENFHPEHLMDYRLSKKLKRKQKREQLPKQRMRQRKNAWLRNELQQSRQKWRPRKPSASS